MSWIDKRKRAPDVPLSLWRVDAANFWDQALAKEKRCLTAGTQALVTSRPQRLAEKENRRPATTRGPFGNFLGAGNEDLITKRNRWGLSTKNPWEMAATGNSRRLSYQDDTRRTPRTIDPRYHSMVGRTIFGLPEMHEHQGAPTDAEAKRAQEDKSYVFSQERRFTHQRIGNDPKTRFRQSATSSQEIGWDAWEDVASVKERHSTFHPQQQSAITNYAHHMLTQGGAPCSIGNPGGNDNAWRTNIISNTKSLVP